MKYVRRSSRGLQRWTTRYGCSNPYVLFTLIFPAPTQDISKHGYVTSSRVRYAYDWIANTWHIPPMTMTLLLFILAVDPWLNLWIIILENTQNSKPWMLYVLTVLCTKTCNCLVLFHCGSFLTAQSKLGS